MATRESPLLTVDGHNTGPKKVYNQQDAQNWLEARHSLNIIKPKSVSIIIFFFNPIAIMFNLWFCVPCHCGQWVFHNVCAHVHFFAYVIPHT